MRQKFKFLPLGYYVAKTAIISRDAKVTFGRHAEIQDYVIIRGSGGRVEIGKNSQLNPFTVVYCGADIFIGDNVMIAPHCTIAGGNHDYVQTDFPMRLAGNLTKGPIIIEDDVWIGANCTVTDGVKIGAHSVIAANSVVTKNIPNNCVAGGVPAKVLYFRE